MPGADKIGLVEYADTRRRRRRWTGSAGLCSQTGYAPVTFEATDLRWAQGPPGTVSAVVTLKAANPQAGDFTYPMEFISVDNFWQLTRRTADALLHPGEDAPPVPTPTPHALGHAFACGSAGWSSICCSGMCTR